VLQSTTQPDRERENYAEKGGETLVAYVKESGPTIPLSHIDPQQLQCPMQAEKQENSLHMLTE